MSQHELATKTGVTFQQLQKYEKGSNRISAGRLYELASVLKVHIGWFFEASPHFALPSANVTSDRQSIELLRVFGTITDSNDRKTALESVVAIAQGNQSSNRTKNASGRAPARSES